jgi:hypothetical protein
MKAAAKRSAPIALLIAISLPFGSAIGQTRLFVYNDTTSTDFSALYLAPAGTTAWGTNQTLNDKDKVLDHSERLTLSGVAPGKYDMKLVDTKGRTCLISGVDLTTKRNFDIRDQTISHCR